jgi:hypothetical protein
MAQGQRMRRFIRLGRPFGRGDQSAREVDPQCSRKTSLEAELELLGLLPTAEDPMLYRGLGKTGFGLFLYLETGLSLQTLIRLGECTDIAGLLTEAVARRGRA